MDTVVSPHKDARITTNKLIPIESIIEYAEREPPLSYQDIANLVGCSKSNVLQRLQAVGYSRLNRKNYEKNRTATFQHIQSKLLNSITDDDIKEINPLQRIVGVGILYDKERLEQGLSTQNIDTHSLTDTVDAYRKRRLELLRTVAVRVLDDDIHIQDVVLSHDNKVSDVPPKSTT